MNYLRIKFHWLLVTVLSVGLMACGSSDGGSSIVSSETILSGTAATGLAAANKTVSVVDADGKVVTTTTDAKGKYTIKVSASASPYMLKVEGTVDGDLFSYASTGGTVNITPMTNLALHEANKNGTTYIALSSLFSSFKDHNNQITNKELEAAAAQVRATMSSSLSSNSVSNSFDFFATAFDADGTGIDGVLDDVAITIGSGGTVNDIVISINNGSTFTFDFNIDVSNFGASSGGTGTGTGTGTGGNTGAALTGTWNLNIAGTVGVSGFNSNLNIDIGQVPAAAVPTAGSFSDMQTAFEAAYGAIGTVSNASYTITSSSSTNVVSNITATVTIPGQVFNGTTLPASTTTYNLNYTYSKN